VRGRIFISYRRGDDPGSAGRLFDALRQSFDPDQLFLDVDNIEPGLDFVEAIQDRVAQSQILLAVIGRHWCDARDADGSRRLDNPSDNVRVEIESALNQKARDSFAFRRYEDTVSGEFAREPSSSIPAQWRSDKA
jgi:TIR domain-containing protein